MRLFGRLSQESGRKGPAASRAFLFKLYARSFPGNLAGARRSYRRAPLVCSQSISRVLDGMRTVPACVTAIPLGRPLPDASSNQPGRQDLDTDPGTCVPHRPYSVLLPVGFALPPALPPARCALTAPFHPYRGNYATHRGGLFSVALSLGSRPPDVIRHRLSMEPGLSSPACTGAAVRLTDALGMRALVLAVKCPEFRTRQRADQS
jgi:hypothetical protein